MIRFLTLLLLVALVWLAAQQGLRLFSRHLASGRSRFSPLYQIWRLVTRTGQSVRGAEQGANSSPERRAAERLVPCAECGVHVVESRASQIGSGEHSTFLCQSCRSQAG